MIVGTKSIWKFPLPGSGVVLMPGGARILSVHLQDEKATVWALVDPKARFVRRVLMSYPTGAAVPSEPGVFLGTLLYQGGIYVLHVFDRGEQPVEGG